MMRVNEPNRPGERPVGFDRANTSVRFRIRRSVGAGLIALSMLVSACTPGEIEQTIGMLEQSFDQAGVEGLLQTGVFIAPEVVMRIGYRLGGPGF